MGCFREVQQQALEAAYGAGRTVNVWYDPSNPREAVLQAGPTMGARSKLATCIALLAAGVLNVVLLVVRLRRWHTGRDQVTSAPELTRPPSRWR